MRPESLFPLHEGGREISVGEPCEHTPGPWQVGCPSGVVKTEIVNATYTHGIATVWTKQAVKGQRDTFEQWEEGEANAHLISAAPELLESCKEMCEWLEFMFGSQFTGEPAQRKARAAIAKAEGGAKING